MQLILRRVAAIPATPVAMPSAREALRVADDVKLLIATRSWAAGGVLMALIASGCAGQHAAAPVGPRLPVAPVSLATNPSPPRQLAPTVFTVTGTAPLPEGAAVSITLTMPAMRMPPTIIHTAAVRGPRVGGRGQNTIFRGDGSFTMGGEWLAEVRVASPRGSMARQIRLQVR